MMFTDKLKNRVLSNRVLLTSVISCVVWCLLAHGIVIFNKISVHDDLGSLLGYNTIIGSYTSGRWAAEIVEILSRCIVGGNVYSTPLFNSIQFILITGLMVYFIVKLLDIGKTGSIIILAGLLTTYPTITGTMGYVFTLVYNQFAYLLVVLSVYLVFCCEKKWSVVLSVASAAFAIGIYQSALPFLLTLVTITAMTKIMNNTLCGKKTISDKAIKSVICIAGTVLLYFICSKLSLFIHHAELSSYQGIEKMYSDGVVDYLKRVKYAYAEYLIPDGNRELYPLNTIFLYYFSLVFVLFFIISIIVKFNGEKKHIESCVLILLLLVLPLAVNFIFVMCDPASADFHVIMKYSNVLLFVLWVAIVDGYPNISITDNYSPVKAISVLLISIILISYVRFSNVCYLRYELKFTQSIAYFTELKTRMESCPGYTSDTPVLYLYELSKAEPETNSEEEFPEVTISPYNLTFINDYAWKEFMNRWIGYNPEIYDADKEFLQHSEIREMPHYPDDGSIAIVDGVLVVNF